MNKITLEQLQNMSIDDMTIAYQNGYILSENTELYDNIFPPANVGRYHESQQRTVPLQTTSSPIVAQTSSDPTPTSEAGVIIGGLLIFAFSIKMLFYLIEDKKKEKKKL